jgi:PIN domain nuclease of toxin-antitoxin system
MRFALDTHIFLWWLENPTLLSKEAIAAIKNGQNIIYISAAVIWEIAIKKSLGKIQIPNDINGVIQSNQFAELPITIAHAQVLEKLPPVHRDPFDRMLIAQSMHEGLTLITRDLDIHKYPLSCLMG